MSCLQKGDKLELELNLQGESHCSSMRDILKTFLKHECGNLSTPDTLDFSRHMDYSLCSLQPGF